MKWNSKGAFALLFILAVMLSGCAGGGQQRPSSGEAPAFSPVSPPEAEELWRQGEQAYKEGKVPNAISAWEKIVRKFPSTAVSARALNRLGEVYLGQGQPDKAIQYFDYVVYAFPRWEGVSAARLNQLRALAQLGKKKQAMKEAVALWESSADKPDVRFGLAELAIGLYAADNDIETAFDWCISGFSVAGAPAQKAALTKETNDVLSRADEGLVRKLYKKNPSPFMRAFLDYRYARIEMQKGQNDMANERLRSILAQNPGHPLEPEIQATVRGSKVATAAGPAGPAVLPNVQPGGPVNADRIGVLVPLNGPNAKYGDMVVRGLNMANSDWNERYPDQKITLDIKDAGSESATAAASFNDLVQGGVLGVIGPLGAQATKAVTPLANRSGMPLLTLTQKEDEPRDSSYVVHVFIDSRDLVSTLVRYCREKLKYERFATLFPDDRYGQRLAKIFAEVVQEQGGTMIASASYKEKSTDFNEPLQKLMTIAKKNAPLSAPEGTPFEALFIPAPVQSVALIAPQLPYNNIVGTTLLGPNLWSEAPLVQQGGTFVDQALFATSFYPDSDNPRIKAFREKFESLYGTTPSYLEAQAYDALSLLLQARATVRGGPADRNAVLQNLLQVKGFKGIAGTYSAGPKGDLDLQYTILQVVNGQLTQVYPK